MIERLQKELSDLNTIIRQIRFGIVKCDRSVYEIYLGDREHILQEIKKLKRD